MKMECRLKLNGHYDKATIKVAQSRGIKDFGFDFRPRSFNFLQNYKFVEILDEIYHPSHKYYLVFEKESDNVLNMFMEDVKKVFATRNALDQFDQQVFLEFTDFREKSFYNSLPMGFYWRVENEQALQEVLRAENLRGLILSFDMLERLHKSGGLFKFIGTLGQGMRSHSEKIELGLDINWSADLFPSLFEFLQFDFYNLSINSQVESSYRNVDESKLIHHLNYYNDLTF